MENALALGTFDGLHKGHMSVVKAAISSGLRSIAVIFADPPAASLLNKKHANILDPLKKIELLKNEGINEVEVLEFKRVKDLSAQQFLEYLNNKYAPKKICCGFNYTFGKEKSGNVHTLKLFCKENNIELFVAEEVKVGDTTVSSSLIRGFIQNGEVNKANSYLLVPFGFKAQVTHGDERGRTIGFPTINQIYPENLVLARFGVYASRCIIDGKEYKSVTNIGLRPTFKNDYVTAETHILNFSGDAYGQNISIILDSFLRDEIRFDNIEQLKNQINIDIKTANGGEI
ncbi:MAG: bifunctional riboflavin kinase/FAD synthetase [Clostridia bacterium]|nr:bifunctional riboflavin kinase/FAD synthetase [Clostridia bacterium]